MGQKDVPLAISSCYVKRFNVHVVALSFVLNADPKFELIILTPR